jgi:hypothetical protein
MEDLLPEYLDPEFNEDDSSETPPTDIVAYNELRSCADLARMTKDGVIDLQPEFQRDVVWTSVDQTRFIDSLVKQLPIPSMCFALDHKTDTWIVIDGLQRMTAVVRFLDGGSWRLAKLDDVDEKISGKVAQSFRNASGDQKKIYDRIQNKTIPITVLRCEFNKKSHMEYLFTVFHRLNSGGSKLNNQEIRNCIYSGRFNSLLKELDTYPDWRKFNLMSPIVEGHPAKNYRFVKQELILRFFAFLETPQDYSGQVGKFLNDYMHPRRSISTDELNGKRILFGRVLGVINKIFPTPPDSRIPTAVVEALMVAIGRNIDLAEHLTDTELKARFGELRASAPFGEEGLAEGLSKTEKVTSRLQMAHEIFAK